MIFTKRNIWFIPISPPEHDKAINYFLENDSDEIEANKKGIHIKKTNYNLENVSQGEVLEYLENLRGLARI